MLTQQLKKKNYIPAIITIVFSALMFLLMLLPNNQYSCMEKMTIIGNGNLDSEGNLIPLNLNIVLPAIFTVFVIICYCFVFLMSVLSFLMSRLYNYHFVQKVNLGFSTLAVLLQIAYLISGINGSYEDNSKVISWGNILTTILNVLFLTAFFITYFKFVSKDYHLVKQEAKKLIDENEVDPYYSIVDEEDLKQKETTIEKKEETKEENSNEDPQLLILNMLKEGKITPDEASKLLSQINKK